VWSVYAAECAKVTADSIAAVLAEMPDDPTAAAAIQAANDGANTAAGHASRARDVFKAKAVAERKNGGKPKAKT
jgi:hypothetical protein